MRSHDDGRGAAARQVCSPISRDDARARGLDRFFTGEPCPRGHVAERYVSGRQCLECARQLSAERYRSLHPSGGCRGPVRRLDDGPRGEAIRAGLTRYSAGIPCSRGHMAERRVADRRCVVCKSDADRARRGGRPALGPAMTVEQKAERYDRYLERCRLTEAKRHARKKGQLGKVEWSDVDRLLKAQKWKCANCGCSVKKKYHIDHITPLARGGLHDRSNLQILCPYCNVSKKDKHPVDWALSMGRLV